MTRKFSKRITRRIKKIIKENEARNIIEKEFTDNRGNKVRLRFDFNPHPIDEPTIKWQRQYGDNE
jgi:hypothetical protein